MNERMTLALFTAMWLLLGPAILAEDAAEGARPALRDIFKQADANADGDITFEELSAVAPNITRERFDQFDRNGDGLLNPEDRTEGRPGGPRRGGQAFAQRFREADKDGNGEVTFEELQGMLPGLTRDRFDRLDRNGDGMITAADRSEARPASPILRMLTEADKDGNGKVTFEEVQAIAPGMTQTRFNRLDRNGDGVLTKADAPETPGRPGRRPGQQARLLHRADANGDLKVTYDEIVALQPGFPKQAFDRLDTNNDGGITAEDHFLRPGGRARGPGAKRGPGRPGVEGGPGAKRGPGPGVKGGPGAKRGPGEPGRRPSAPWLRRADVDGNGETTREEARKAFPNMPPAVFDRLDRNGDGVISEKDMARD